MSLYTTSEIPCLVDLCAKTIVSKTTPPDISYCSLYLCNLLLDQSIRNKKLSAFRGLLEQWPHEVLTMSLTASTLDYIQSLAILEHQGIVSKVLKTVYINAPYSGYISTNVLCSSALGLLEDYTCLVSQVKDTSLRSRDQSTERSRKRSRRTPPQGRVMTVYSPLNINSSNVRSLLRYLRTPLENRFINVIPSGVIFTSLPSSLIFKALDLLDPGELKMLGIDFSLQSGEELSSTDHIPVLNRFKRIRSVSLTYNYLTASEKEYVLINSIKSMPSLFKLNLSGNVLKNNAHLYTPSTIRELNIGNTFPTVESLENIGQICGKHLVYLKLSDNGINKRIAGLLNLLSRCEVLTSLDLAGNQFAETTEILQLFGCFNKVESTLERLILSHNMIKEGERMSIISKLSRFSSLRALVLGPYLPDLLMSDEIQSYERRIMSFMCGRPDIAMVGSPTF